MAVARTERTYPLTLKSNIAYALNTGLVAAYDFAGNPANSYAGGDGAPHIGTRTLTKDSGATFPVVTAAPGILGRDTSNGKSAALAYRGMSIGPMGFGSADGKASFTIYHRYRTPSVVTLAAAGVRTVAAYADAGGVKVNLSMFEHPSGYVYFYWRAGGGSGPYVPSSTGYTTTSFRAPMNTIVDLHLVRDGDTLSAYLNGVLMSSITYPELVVYNTAWTGSTNGTQHGITSATLTDLILVDQAIWSRALSGPEVTQHYNDPYAGYENSAAVVPGIKITSPPAGSTVNSEGFQFSGTYSGTVPTSIQARFSGGSWVTVVSNPSGGSFMANMPAVTAGTGLLEVRYSNNTSITDSVSLTAAPPAATVRIASQGAPDGQNITIGVAFTRSNSISVDLVAAGNGAISKSETVDVGYNAVEATINVTLTQLESGDYTVVVSSTSASGKVLVSGQPFTILGVSGGGSGPGDAPTVTLPGAPTGVSATAGNGFVDVSFTAPTNTGGGEISNYRATASSGQSATAEASPIRLSIPNGVAATVTVAAINSAGTGPESAASNTVTPAPTAPTAPRNVTANASSGGAVVSFVAPVSDGGSPVLDYRVTASTGDVVVGSSSPILVDSPDGVVATFTVQARNAIGLSPVSAPSAPVTPGSVPGAPFEVTAAARNGYALVSFTPSDFDGGWPVMAFRVTSSTGQVADGNGSPVRITVPRDAEVTFTVQALNEIGYSASSAPSNPVIPRAPVARIRLVGSDGQPIPNIGGLNWAWFDQATPHLFTAPVEKGTSEGTDSTGDLLVPLPGSNLWVGEIGWLVVTNSNGSPLMQHKAFSGPVAVQ